MNKGIRLAKGKYLCFMNAGDIFYNNDVLENVIPYLNNDTDILYGNCAIFSEKRKKMDCKKPFTDLLSGFASGHTIYHQASFLKKDLFYLYGLYDEKFKIAGDYDCFVKFFIKKAKFTYIDRTICTFDLTGISSRNRELAKQESEVVQNKYFTLKEIQDSYKKYDNEFIDYNILEKLFSIKKSSNRMYKIITFFNIHVRFKCQKIKQERKNCKNEEI